MLPQSIKNKIKVIFSKYPYIVHPSYLLNSKKYLAELEKILKEEKYDGIVIYPPTIDWHMPLFQRPQQLAKVFAKKNYLFFYCTNNLRFDRVNGFEKIEKNLYLTNLTHLLKKIEAPTLLISWPFNEFYAHRFNSPYVIYDYIDKLEVFDSRGKSKKELYNDHLRLVKNSDLVVATADKLLKDVQKLKPKKTILVPNGVDTEHFRLHIRKEKPTDLEKIIKKGNPIIGYYGAIAEWFDYDLVEKVAKERPDYEYVIIGPLDYDKTLKMNSHLFEIKNIHFLGQKNYEELPTYLRCFDVATIPFKVNAITKATSPVKLFEYMAGEKPIVTTAMDECRKYESVLVAKDHNDFVKKIDLALEKKNDPKYLNLLQREADENSWGNRITEVLCYIKLAQYPKLKAIQDELEVINGEESYYTKAYRVTEIFYWEPVVSWIDELKKVQSVIDIGGAYGTLLIYVSKKFNPKVRVLMDPVSKNLPEKVIEKNKIIFRNTNIETSADIPKNEKFDLIILTEVIEHFNYQPIKTLEKIREMLSEDGHLIVSTPDAKEWGKQLKYYKKFSEIPVFAGQKDEWIDDHIWQYSKEELEKIFKQVGLEIVKYAHAQGVAAGHLCFLLKKGK